MTAREEWRIAWAAARRWPSVGVGAEPLPIHELHLLAVQCLASRRRTMARAAKSTDLLDLRITVRGWDTWDTPVESEPRPRYMRGGPL